MRKILLNIALLALIFSIGCSEDEDRYAFQESAGLYISSDGLTQLDTQFTIDVEASNIKCTEVTFTPGGVVTITNGVGSITLSADTYELYDVDSAAYFEAVANIVSNPLYFYDIAVSEAVSVGDPGVMHSDSMYYFTWNVEPVSATVTGVTIETKVGVNDTYAAVTGPFSAEDSTGFTGTDYATGDTIYVKLTASTASKSTTKVTMLNVSPYSYENVATFMLDTTTNLAYDFMLQRYVDASVAGDSADIEFYAYYAPGGGLVVSFEAPQKAEFVPATASDYANADVVDIETTNFSSAITDAVANAGDVYMFRTQRGAGDYFFGIMKVTKVDKPQGVVEDSYFEIEIKY